MKFSDGRTESYSSIVSEAGLVLYIPGIYEFIDDPDVIEVFFSDPLPQELRDFLVKAHRDRDEISGPPPQAKVIYSSEDIKLKDPLKKPR